MINFFQKSGEGFFRVGFLRIEKARGFSPAPFQAYKKSGDCSPPSSYGLPRRQSVISIADFAKSMHLSKIARSVLSLIAPPFAVAFSNIARTSPAVI